MKKLFDKNQKGFTLIELLVVIFIIGILAGVLLPNFVSSRERARDSRRKHDLAEVKNALRLYYNDNQAYPAALTFGSAWIDGDNVYMRMLPEDPQYENLGSPYEYLYCRFDDNDSFILSAMLENQGDAEIEASAERCAIEDSLGDCGLFTDDCYDGDEDQHYCYYICGD